MSQVDKFQPMAIVNKLKEMREKIKEVETEIMSLAAVDERVTEKYNLDDWQSIEERIYRLVADDPIGVAAEDIGNEVCLSVRYVVMILRSDPRVRLDWYVDRGYVWSVR